MQCTTNIISFFFSIPHHDSNWGLNSKVTHKVSIAETITKVSINTENNAPYVIPYYLDLLGAFDKFKLNEKKNL